MSARSDAARRPRRSIGPSRVNIGWPIRSFRLQSGVPTQPRGFLSDGIAGARLWTRLFGCHNRRTSGKGEGVPKKLPNSDNDHPSASIATNNPPHDEALTDSAP